MYTLALDRSARHLDVDGRLHVDRSHISKAIINPYLGKEIPGYIDLGLDGDKIYQLLRDPVELERGASTFVGLQILSKHIPVDVDEPHPELVVGAIGSNVVFNAPYLDADLTFWDAKAIAGIETGSIEELSCGYRYVPVMEAGEYEGKVYDGRMTQIKGNHLALVEVGRAGSDVVVADHNPFKIKESAMRMTKLGKALHASISAASKKLAADSALAALVGEADIKTFKPAEVKAKLLALDADMDPDQLDGVMDTLMGVANEPKAMEPPKKPDIPAEDDSPADKLRALLAGKVDDAILEQAMALLGAPVDQGVSPQTMQTAMDALSVKLRTKMRDANTAAREVRATVGDVDMDSAEEIYGFALDHMGIKSTGINDVVALRTLFQVASGKSKPATKVIAQDSANDLVKKFPGLARIGRA